MRQGEAERAEETIPCESAERQGQSMQKETKAENEPQSMTIIITYVLNAYNISGMILSTGQSYFGLL